MVRRSHRFGLVLAWALAAVRPSLAAKTPTEFPRANDPVFLVIFDVRPPRSEIERPDETSAISFPYAQVSKTTVICSQLPNAKTLAVAQLAGVVGCAIGQPLAKPTDKNASAGSIATLTERTEAAALIAANFAQLRTHTSARAISARQSEIVLAVLQTASRRTVTVTCPDLANEEHATKEQDVDLEILGRKPTFSVKESERKTQLESDLAVLAAVAGAVRAQAALRPATCTPTADPFKETPAAWLTATHVVLSKTRADVQLEATLPAAVPTTLAKDESEEAKHLIEAARASLAAEDLKKQREREREDLKIVTAPSCPSSGADRFEALSYVACGLLSSGLDDQIAAVDGLARLNVPSRASLLRWAVEHAAPAVRQRALVALAQVPAPAPPGPPGAAKEAKQSLSFASGPMEHWSLSANVFTTRQSLLKRGSDGNLTLSGTPAVFYVSVNFLLGDLASTDRGPVQNLELKWLIEGSRHPFDSLGFGIGLRGSYAEKFGLDFDVLSPFVAWTWTKRPDPDTTRDRQFRFGLALNLDKALDWVK